MKKENAPVTAEEKTEKVTKKPAAKKAPAKKVAKPVEEKAAEVAPVETEKATVEATPEENAADLSYVSLKHVDKIYDNNVQAVFDFNLDIKKKEFIVFVGPSGCGKSTTLRMIAGLEDITKGELYIDGEYSNDRTPKDRDIAMVFQSYALYPHMTVYNNMAFGLKIRHLPKDEIDRRVREAARILQIEEYLDRKPKALSGGQRQRVALGRAIVRNAKVFLMDEPLSNLDAKLRVQMRSEIIKLHEALGATTIYVTHDQTEAMTMASRIVVMKLGYIQQVGSPIEIYTHPANLFVAGFIGSPAMNFVRGNYNKGVVEFDDGTSIKLTAEAVKAYEEFYKGEGYANAIADLKAKREDLSNKINHMKNKDEKLVNELAKMDEKIAKAESGDNHEIIYGIRPEDVVEAGSNKNFYNTKVAVAELLGHEYYVHVDFAGIDLIAKIPLTHEIKIGDPIKLSFKEEKAHIFDPLTEKTIY